MITLTREKGNRMWGGGSGSGGVGGGGSEVNLAGYATESWVDENYLSIEFFSKLFKAYNGTTLVNPNDTQSTITNIKAMFGFWTEQYISALGQNSGGGGGGASSLGDLLDVNLTNPSNGQVLKYDSSTGKWINGTAPSSGGTVTSVGLSAPPELVVIGSPITTNGTFTISYATGRSIPLTADVSKGVTAYGWGDHSQAGYALQSTIDAYTWWGRSLSNGIVSGNMDDVGNISMTGSINGAKNIELNTKTGHSTTDGGFIDFHYNGSSANYTSRIIESESGILEIINNAKVDGYLLIGDCKLVWESANNALKLIKSDGTAVNMYATGGVSALGLSSGTAGSIDNLTIDSYLYLGDTDHYIRKNSTSLQLVSSGTITMNGGVTVSLDGGTVSATTVRPMTLSTGNTLTDATIEIYHNGTKYYLNKAAAISAGILTTTNG